jgi:hypothetical protein
MSLLRALPGQLVAGYPIQPVIHVIRHLVAIDREIRPANGFDFNGATGALARRGSPDL